VIKALLVTMALVLCGLVCEACGGTSHQIRRGSTLGPSTEETGAASSAPVSIGTLAQDEDDDDGPGEEVGLDPHDPDLDGDNDHLKPRGYYDRDDGPFRTYGRPASGTEKRKLAALTKRYYKAAVAADGRETCSMLTIAFARSVPQDFGRGSGGPAYLHAADTCAAVMTLLLRHLHAQLSEAIEIVGVRVEGEKGLVLIGAKNVPASYVDVQREGGDWRVVGMLASPLP
jgi:hypothetical protein